uniref:Uncharacterized protein n=2 Tax=Juglanconis TaxID=1940564 RepID=A0A291LJB8_9PEZI|nr:hypothetical protein [Juglanconis sp.]ATI20430.1 hypothetical protein [Juglanconis juglandina]
MLTQSIATNYNISVFSSTFSTYIKWETVNFILHPNVLHDMQHIPLTTPHPLDQKRSICEQLALLTHRFNLQVINLEAVWLVTLSFRRVLNIPSLLIYFSLLKVLLWILDLFVTHVTIITWGFVYFDLKNSKSNITQRSATPAINP